MAEHTETNPLRLPDLQLAEHVFQTHAAYVDPAINLETLQNPQFWVNTATKIRMGDVVRVIAFDMSWMADLFCSHAIGSSMRRMVLLQSYDLRQESTSLEPLVENLDFEIALRGPKKWCIVSKKTGEVVKEMIPSKVEAEVELDQYLRALAA